MRAQSNLSRPCHACTTAIKFLLRLAYVDITSTPLLRSKYFLTPQRPHYAFLTCSKFDHVLHVHEDLTTLLLRLTSFYYAPSTSFKSFFQGRSKNVAECEEGIKPLLFLVNCIIYFNN